MQSLRITAAFLIVIPAIHDPQLFVTTCQSEDVRPVHVFSVERWNDELSRGHHSSTVEQVDAVAPAWPETETSRLQPKRRDETVIAKLHMLDLVPCHCVGWIYSGNCDGCQTFTIHDVQIFDF